MRKFFKIVFDSFVVLFALALLITAVLRILYPPAKLRRMLDDKLRQEMHREARLGDIGLDVRGLSLQRLQLSETPTFGAGTFLEVDRARLRWSLWPLFERRLIFSVQQCVLHLGNNSAYKVPATLSNIQLMLRNFSGSQVQGTLSIQTIASPVYKAQKLYAEWSLKGIDAQLAHLTGWMRLKQGPGVVQNLDKMANASPAARVAFMPLILLQNIDRSGFVHLGLPDLSHLVINDIVGDYVFKNGTMTINKFAINGPQLSINALGTIQLASGQLAVEVRLHTPQPTLLGAMDLKMTVTGTLSNPKTNLDSLKKQAFKATVQGLLDKPDAQKAIDRALKQIFH